MRVTHLEACTLAIPLERGVAFATRSVAERHYTLVRVRTDEGVEGLGFCYSGHRAGGLTTQAVRELLRDVVLGQDPHQVEAIWDALFREALLHGRRGLVLRAMSAIDIALWDCIARAAGLPLYRYLGAYREGTVPAYASGGYYQEGKTPEHLAQEMLGYLDMGFRAVKMKVGRLDPRQDAQRIAAVRQAIGPEVALMLDANNAWTDVPTAVRAIRMWEEFAPFWIEEPLPPDDITGHAAIARQVQTPVATGEIEATRWGFQALLERGAAAYLQPDAAVCGGITEWRRIAAMAAGFGVPVAPHWFADLHVHLVAATPNACYVEYFTDLSILNLKAVFQTSLEVREGALVLPERPGLGIELDQAAVRRYTVDGWR